MYLLRVVNSVKDHKFLMKTFPLKSTFTNYLSNFESVIIFCKEALLLSSTKFLTLRVLCSEYQSNFTYNLFSAIGSDRRTEPKL